MDKKLIEAITKLVGGYDLKEITESGDLTRIDNSAQYITVNGTEYSIETMSDQETFYVSEMPNSEAIGFLQMNFKENGMTITCNEAGGHTEYTLDYFKNGLIEWLEAKGQDESYIDEDKVQDYLFECGYNVVKIEK